MSPNLTQRKRETLTNKAISPVVPCVSGAVRMLREKCAGRAHNPLFQCRPALKHRSDLEFQCVTARRWQTATLSRALKDDLVNHK